MATSDNRIPANQVVWLLAGLLAIWVGWLFLPKFEKPRVVSAPVVAESKLRAVGLPDNPDWDGLPELFAVWATQAPWKDGKVQFAYWNTGAHAYSDFFEARQEAGRVRFRVLSRTAALQRKEALGEGGLFFLTDTDRTAAEIAAVDLGTDSPTHPFVFFQEIPPARAVPQISNPSPLPAVEKVPRPQLPAGDIRLPLRSDEPRRK